MDDDQGNPEDDQHPAFRTGRIRIIGAEQAAEAVRPLHARTDGGTDDGPDGSADAGDTAGGAVATGSTGADSAGSGSGSGTGSGDGDGDGPTHGRDPLLSLDDESGDDPAAGLLDESAGGIFDGPELPHWTEAPTGEVPAVLSCGSKSDDEDDDPWASLPTPTWREENADWDVSDGGFEPAALGGEGTGLGSLVESADAERQPWTFELTGDTPGSNDAPIGASGDIDSDSDVWTSDDNPDNTMIVPSVSAPRPATAPDDRIIVGGDDLGSAAPSIEVKIPPAPDRDTAGVGRITLADDDDADFGEEGERRRLTRGSSRPRRRPRPVPAAPEGGDRSVHIGGTPAAPAPTPSAAGGTGVVGSGVSGVSGPSASVSTRPVSRPVSQAPPGGRSTVRQRPAAFSGGGSSKSSTSNTPPNEPGRAGRNVPVAIITGLGMMALLLISGLLGPVAVLVVVTIIVFLAVAESFAAFRKAGYQPATLLGLAAAVSLMIATYNKGLSGLLPLVTVLVVAATFLWYIADVEPGADAVRGVSSTLLVYGWVVVFGSFGALLLAPGLFPDRHGVAFFMAAVVVGVACDVGSYGSGVAFGRHALAPSISPGKTVEGLIGGAVAAVLAGAIILHFVHPWTSGKGAVLGLVVVVVAPIGDLCESLIKRTLGLKDMSNLLPGHGGILDRVDGLMFVLPATYYLVKAFHMG